jgi:NAD(P)-dependent dehydrogenase (short-subunit alcohol dehydrogenase family)
MARSALVTGGSSGIGLAIARLLREEGLELTLVSRTTEKVERAAAELGAQAVAANVADEDDCRRLVAAHADRFGSLDVLVNSAGVGIAEPLESVTTKFLDRQLAINLRGLLLVTREAIPLLKASRGLVVNLASIAGTIPAPGLGVYGATKAAVISLTRTLNAELEADGVRCTAICPAFVGTPMTEFTGMSADEMIRPEDCAEVVRMLLRTGPRARFPEIVIERVGETSARLPF